MGDKVRYFRICETVQDYGKYIPVTEDIYKHVKQDRPYYQSIYQYSEEQVEEAKKIIEVEKNGKKTKRPRGISGITDVVTKKLVFDFDDKEQPENAQKDAITIVDRLVDKGFKEEDLGIFFSGGKGFHVEVETDKLLTPHQAKSIAEALAKDLPTFDSVVYNPARIFRVPYTKHNSSGFYKTRLSPEELRKSSVQEVLEIAKDAYEPEGLQEVHLPEGLLALASEKEGKVEYESKVERKLDDSDHNPLGLSNWKAALLRGEFPPGQRSNALIILTATLKGKGFDADECYALLKATIRKQAEKYDQDVFSKEEFYQNIVEQVFSPTWQGGTFAEDNFPEGIKQHLMDLGIPRVSLSKLDTDLVVDVEQGLENFFDYATKIDENRMEFGISALDRLLKPQVGHFVGLLGPAGSGKTSLALELLSSMSKKGIKCYFGSYDMNSNILFQKLLQRETGLSDDEIYDVYKSKDLEQIKNFKSILKKHYSNVVFDFKVGSTIEGLKRSIAKKEQELGEEVKLVVVDYIELIMSDKSDATAASAEAAQGLREIANAGKLVVVLLQPNKMSTKLDEAPKSYTAAKGSSAIAQAVTSMMGVFRPGYSPEDPSMDKFYGIAILKNRMGPLGTCYFNWDGPRGLITEMEDIQRAELQEFLEWKKANSGDGDHGL